MAVSEKDAPFIEPYAIAGNSSGFKSKGKTALAVKRALAHLGFLEWEPDKWDEHWNAKVNDASAAWKRKRGIIPESSADGSWGKKAHDTMRSAWYEKDGKRLPAFDGQSQKLLQQEKAASVPVEEPIDAVRSAIVDFFEAGLNRPGVWNYTQGRPVDVSVNPWSDSRIDSDCSGSVIQGFYYAKRETGLGVQDPAKQFFSGFGNTDLYEDDWPTASDSYEVGDLAHYQGHVTCCIKRGDWSGSDWWSFGSEPPTRRKLNYRSDYRKTVRPVILP